jgi:hypothetical protein
MKNDIEILFPHKTLKLAIHDTVTVRELAWRDALELIRMLADALSKLAADGDLTMDNLRERLPALVLEAEAVSDFVAVKSTGRDPGWLADLPVRDAMTVLDEALALTLNDEVLARAKKLGSRLGSMTGMTDPKAAGTATG